MLFQKERKILKEIFGEDVANDFTGKVHSHYDGGVHGFGNLVTTWKCYDDVSAEEYEVQTYRECDSSGKPIGEELKY